jgi:hypothetical protein
MEVGKEQEPIECYGAIRLTHLGPAGDRSPPIFQTATRSGNAINLAFSGQAGVGYQLQYSKAIEPFDWMNLGSPITATNALMTVSDPILPAGNPSRFYRLLVLPQAVGFARTGQPHR